MKCFKSTYVLACVLMLLMSCSVDNDPNTEQDITSALLLKEQQPLKTNDIAKNGLYHGAVLASNSNSRGKIWINIANNGNYSALVELVSGNTTSFSLKPGLIEIAETVTIYEFESENGYFIFDISDINQPVITEINLYNEYYFAQVVKSMSYNMASVATAVFTEIGNPTFSGTWSLIADGSITNPNGNNGDGITSSMIIYNAVVYEDFIFDTFNATTCFGNSGYVPTLNSFSTLGFTISDYQTTVFGNGTSKWNLSYDATSASYMNYFICDTAPSGTFTWTSTDGTIYKVGEIVLD